MSTTRTGRRILVCPDKFKGTLSAPEAAAVIERGIRRVFPDAAVRLLPVADGGEGTVDSVIAAGASPRTDWVDDPLGRPVQATWARWGEVAVVEIAAASGLSHVTPTADTAAAADTFGTGQLVVRALDDGATSIVIGLGGSATTDGGTGILRALGAEFLDHDGAPLPPGGGSLHRLARVNLDGLDPRIRSTPVVICCDVASPLLGPHGAARVFGPQKGADAQTIEQLEAGLTRLASVLAEETGRDPAALGWGGAAGGAAAGLHVALGATFRRGVDEVAELLHIDDHLAAADLVVVGEGSLDEQSLAGKAPIGIAERAARLGVSVVAVVGRLAVSRNRLRESGIAVAVAAADLAGSTEAALLDPERWTMDAAEAVMRLVSSWPESDTSPAARPVEGAPLPASSRG